MKNKIIKEVVKVIATDMVSSDPYEWPPSCIFFSYQPSRPHKTEEQCSKKHTSDIESEK